MNGAGATGFLKNVNTSSKKDANFLSESMSLLGLQSAISSSHCISNLGKSAGRWPPYRSLSSTKTSSHDPSRESVSARVLSA